MPHALLNAYEVLPRLSRQSLLLHPWTTVWIDSVENLGTSYMNKQYLRKGIVFWLIPVYVSIKPIFYYTILLTCVLIIIALDIANDGEEETPATQQFLDEKEREGLK